jgi:hypothetical protein
MKRTRILVSATIVLSSLSSSSALLPIGASAALPAQLPSRVSAVIHTGRVVRFDPQAPWLWSLYPLPFRMVQAPRLADAAADSLSSWLIGERVSSGVQHWLGGTFAGTVTQGDPAFLGWLSTYWNTNVYGRGDSSVSVHAVSVELTSADGGWLGDLTGVGDAATGAFQLHGTLTGLAENAGKVMVVDLQAGASSAEWTLEGIVLTGPLPPSAGPAGPVRIG